MKKKALIIIFFLILTILFLVGLTYLQMGKPIQEIFDRFDRITEDQHLTDTTFTLVNLNSHEKKVLDLNKYYIFSFRSLNNTEKFKDEDIINELIESKQGLYIILNDTTNLNETLKNRLPLYYVDTINLPFKHKKLLYPYTIVIENKKIKKIILEDLEKIINNESDKN